MPGSRRTGSSAGPAAGERGVLAQLPAIHRPMTTRPSAPTPGSGSRRPPTPTRRARRPGSAAWGFDVIEMPIEDPGRLGSRPHRRAARRPRPRRHRVRRHAPGPRAGGAPSPTWWPAPRRTCAAASTPPPPSVPASWGPMYASVGAPGGWRRRAARPWPPSSWPRCAGGRARRRAGCGWPSSRSTATRRAWSTPSSRASRWSTACPPRPSGWRSTRTTSTSRSRTSAAAIRPGRRPAWPTCRCAPTTAAPRAPTTWTGWRHPRRAGRRRLRRAAVHRVVHGRERLDRHRGVDLAPAGPLAGRHRHRRPGVSLRSLWA